MNIVKSFKNALDRMQEKNWDCIYVLVDVHGTIFFPSYNNEETYEFYPYAEETLQILSQMPNVKLILWSCTKKEYFDKYLKVLNDHEIYPDYCNENPEVKVQPSDPESLSFDTKWYYNVGIDDKFGFDANEDWEQLYYFLSHYYLENFIYKDFFSNIIDKLF